MDHEGPGKRGKSYEKGKGCLWGGGKPKKILHTFIYLKITQPFTSLLGTCINPLIGGWKTILLLLENTNI